MTDIHSESASRKHRRHAEKSEIIAGRALQIISEEGIDALTLGRLGRELHLVPAALYRYFPSKDALIAELQRRTLASIQSEFTVAVSALPDSDGANAGLARVWAAGQFYLDLPTSNPDGFRLVTQLLADPRPLVALEEANKTAPQVFAFLREVGRIIEEATAAGSFAPGNAMDRALVLWATLQGVAQLGKLTRFDAKHFNPARLGSVALADLLVGWGARRQDVVSLSEARSTNTKRRNRS